MADLELGNIIFNHNTNHRYDCPNYIVALLNEVNRRLKTIMWNINQEEYDSPFENTGNSFELGNFKIQAFSWDDSVVQEYNFLYTPDTSKSNLGELKISWYKYLGRDTTINMEIDANVIIDIFNDVINQLNKYEELEMKKKYGELYV